MTFSTGDTLAREGGGSCKHLKLPITISGVTRTLRFTVDELQGDPPADIAEARTAILDRLRSAAKEAGASTLTQLKTALESKTFQV